MRASVVVLCFSLASCGTILNGGPFMVPVNSNPAGATVHYKGAAVGRTPCQVAMYPTDTRLVLVLDGHHNANLEVPTSMNWWSICNAGFLIPGIIIGNTIDAITGGWWVVDTQAQNVRLTSVYADGRSWLDNRPKHADPAPQPQPLGDTLFLSAPSRMLHRLIVVEAVDGMRVTVRAVDGGESETIETPFTPEAEMAKRLLVEKKQVHLLCYRAAGS